jgi:hypothetical protein
VLEVVAHVIGPISRLFVGNNAAVWLGGLARALGGWILGLAGGDGLRLGRRATTAKSPEDASPAGHPIDRRFFQVRILARPPE